MKVANIRNTSCFHFFFFLIIIIFFFWGGGGGSWEYFQISTFSKMTICMINALSIIGQPQILYQYQQFR